VSKGLLETLGQMEVQVVQAIKGHKEISGIIQ
jgi:hypothetical protein